MRLLNVRLVLDRESNIEKGSAVTLQSGILEERDDSSTDYAILSHRWGSEVTYGEIIKLSTMAKEKRDEVRSREGYHKILRSCEQAVEHGLDWLWVDTCCIDKRSSSELSEAINSMYRWYGNSTRCYVYLKDVDKPTFPRDQDSTKYVNSGGWPEWFSRGWTLQELIAARDVQFFNKRWESVGNKRTLASTLGLITRIPGEVLKGDISTTEVCGAQIMSWAADRKTTRVEDRAYSLLGLFGVNMPMLYGEGRKAFQRLQLEILRVSNDHSIFAWDLQGKIRRFGSVLADDPSYFRDCHDVRILKPDQFIKHLKEDLRGNLGPAHFLPAQLGKFAQLTLRGHACADKLRKLSVTNRGVEMCLPLTPYHVSPPVYRAVLACTQSHANLLVTIDLVHHESSYYRCIGATGGRLPQAIPAFRQLYLAYRQDQTCCNVTLYEGVISYHGFTRCGAFPLDITGNSIALSSLANSLTVLVYANDKAKARFAVGLGYHHIHQQWVHVVCDEPGDGWSPWADYAKRAYERLRNAYTGITGDSKERYKPGYYVNHAHLPRSIWAAKVVWGQSRVGNATVTVDVDQCTGCCYGPLEWRVTADDRDGLPIPGLMKMDIAYKRGHWLLVDGIHIKLLECTTQMIALGDYGDWDRKDETFKCNGNIFEELRTLSGVLAVKPNDPACRPVKRIVSSAVKRDDGVETVVDPKTFPPLVLRGPVGWLLPNSRHLILLLKALSARLTDKYLVTAVVQCSAYRAFGSSSEWVEKAGSGVNEHSKDHSVSTGPHNITALCSISQPQVWCRDETDKERRKQFEVIREQFHILLDFRLSTAPGTRDDSVGGRQDDVRIEGALEFFSNMFGVKYLENYVGSITFFKELVGLTWDGVPSVTIKDGIRCESLLLGEPEVVQNPRIETAVANLLKIIRRGRKLKSSNKRKIEQEALLISKTLAFEILEDIRAVYEDAPFRRGPLRDCVVNKAECKPDFDGFGSHLRQIKDLQAKFDEANDVEKRALEEDITGRMLWLCWTGIHREVKLATKEIVLKIVKDELNAVRVARRRSWVLNEIGKIFEEALAEPVNDDHQVHLRRIMADAEKGTLKYELFRSARDMD